MHVQRRGACPSLPHTLSACRDSRFGPGCLPAVHSVLWYEKGGREKEIREIEGRKKRREQRMGEGQDRERERERVTED